MYDIEREEQIINILKQRTSISVAELATVLYVSTATIRRDLNKLEAKGLVTRTFGGVCLFKRQANRETAQMVRAEENVVQKKTLCRLVMPYIQDNMCLFLDSSTTVLQMAQNLNQFENLTIITTGIGLANQILNHTQHEIILTGGIIQHSTNSMLGAIATQTIESLHADLAIMSSTGLSLDFGFSESTIEQSHIKQAMIRNSDKVIYMVANNKFEKRSLNKTVDIKGTDILITDQKPTEEYINRCLKDDVQLVYPIKHVHSAA